MAPGPANGGPGVNAQAAAAAAMAAGAAAAGVCTSASAMPSNHNNASLRQPQMPNSNPLLTVAAEAAKAAGGLNLPWPQNMRPKEAMPISPPLTPLPATMR
jgi:hypothetical protein